MFNKSAGPPLQDQGFDGSETDFHLFGQYVFEQLFLQLESMPPNATREEKLLESGKLLAASVRLLVAGMYTTLTHGTPMTSSPSIYLSNPFRRQMPIYLIVQPLARLYHFCHPLK